MADENWESMGVFDEIERIMTKLKLSLAKLDSYPMYTKDKFGRKLHSPRRSIAVLQKLPFSRCQ